MINLQGKSVLVTKSGHQGKALSREIDYRGGRSVFCPMIKIVGSKAEDTARNVAENIESYDFAIFISRNAVRYGLKILAEVQKELPQMPIYAVGPGTAMELKLAGVEGVRFPYAPHSSEGLLRLEGLRAESLIGRHAVIFRGKGGSATLASTLEDRGAEVSVCECYERLPPRVDLKKQLARAEIPNPDIGLATSLESLNNLVGAIRRDGIPNLLDMQMIVVSDRLGLELDGLGFSLPPLITTEPSNEGILEQITLWVQKQG